MRKFFSIICAIFKSKTDEAEKDQASRKTIIEPDFIDYDGMGNQGRFPVCNKKRK